MNPLERVAAWADETVSPAPAVTSSNGFDLPGFIARHEQLRVRKEKSLRDGTALYELWACPFNAEHTKGSAGITKRPDGLLGFKCFHKSCAGKGWKELRAFLEPNYSSDPSPGVSGTAKGVGETNQKAARAQTGDACFNLTSLQSLLNEPEEKVTWILDRILPAGGLSLLNGKPKAGKSTLARCLALAVARGKRSWSGPP